MILISHDTWTFLRPRKWYMWPFRIFTRCQTHNLVGQYRGGARGFDLRVYFRDGTRPVFKHGLMEFKGNVYEQLKILNSMSDESRDFTCRVILEVKRYSLSQESSFKVFCDRI